MKKWNEMKKMKKKKKLTLTDRAIYFGFRVVHSGTMLR